MKKVAVNVDVDIDAIRKRVLESYQDDTFFNNTYLKIKESNDNLDLIDVIEVIENQRICQNCNCLDECKQKIKGHCLHITNNTMTYQACKYQKEMNNLNDKYRTLIYSSLEIARELPKLQDVEVNGTRAKVIKHVNDLLNNKTNKGLFLSGPPGVGKSFIIEALLNEYLKSGVRCAYLLLNEFSQNMKTLYYSFETEDKDEFNRIITRLQKVNVLVIDDIGAERVDAFLRDELLFPILDYRMKHSLLTNFTSNYSLAMLDAHYKNTSAKLSEPIKASRLMERIRVLSDEYVLKEEKSRR